MKKTFNKRLVRNVIMVLMIVALGVGAYFTLDSASSKNAGPSIGSSQSEFGSAPFGELPENFTDGNQSDSSDSSSSDSGDSSNSQQPPEMPSGDSSNSQQPPEMPSGDSSNLPQKPDGNFPDMKGSRPGGKTSIALYCIFAAECALIAVILLFLIMSEFNKKGIKETFKDWKRVVIFILAAVVIGGCLTVAGCSASTKLKGNSSSQVQMMPGGQNGGMPGGSGDSTGTSVEASGATTVDGSEESLSENYSSTTSDESAILVTNGGNATVSGSTITKSGDSTNTENSEFYGVNAAVLVQSGSTATVKDATINTEAKGANAVFATGEDAKIYISDSTVTSTGESSARGLDATYGGYIEADNVTVTTQGGSCASLATDRGEGTVKASNSKLETNGSGSPVIYSTGDISIDSTTGTANGSQMVVIEGKNSATVIKSTLNASAKGNRKDVDQAGVMIYQSMSGDASEGTGTFTATDSTLEIQSSSDYYKTAPMFFVTNTDAVINLTNTKLVYGSGVLLNAAATSEWGNSGSNGGNVTLNAENQTLKGDVTADEISTVSINLTASTFEGAINGDNSAKEVTLKLDKDSKITLTGDTYVTALDDEDSTYSNINFGSYKLYVNGKAIN